jgi:hypothetical protein
MSPPLPRPLLVGGVGTTSLVLALMLVSGCADTSGTCKETTDCQRGRACCAGVCTDTENDRANCGACGTVCEVTNASTSCRVGRCQFQCLPGWGNCNDDRADGCELDIATNPDHCGLCGRTCVATNAASTCSQSACGLGACSAGFGNCDADSTNGCETDTKVEVSHCGGCDRACRLDHATPKCEGSTCRVERCDADFADCDGASANGCEVSLRTDALHCGRCGVVCGPGLRCIAAECRAEELIVFGGQLSFTASNTTGELYEFDLVTKTFTALAPATPGGQPSARRGHVAAWDQPRNRMLVWGGIDGAGTLATTDAWALDFTVVPPAWQKLSTTGTPPSPRFGCAAALDATGARWFIFGGSTDLGGGLSELYSLDLVTLAWTQHHGRNAAGAPGDRLNAAGAFDTAARAFLVFGGNDATTGADRGDLWAWDVAQGAWRGPLPGSPAGRARAAFFSGAPVHLFSGVASLLQPPANMLDELQALDVRATPPWTVLATTGPAARFGSAHTTRDGKLYVFAGGTTGPGGQAALADLWEYTPSSRAWLRLFDGTGTLPPGRLSATMVAR